jgi:ethanolamine utilization protein EutM
MRGQPVTAVLTHTAPSAMAGILSASEFNPLIQQDVVFELAARDPTENGPDIQLDNMNAPNPTALGFIETQGFTAIFEAIDTACKAANVEVVAKEKLGGGYVTVVIQGELSAVTAAVAAGQAKVEGLGKLVAAHVVARPSSAVLKLLPKL